MSTDQQLSFDPWAIRPYTIQSCPVDMAVLDFIMQSFSRMRGATMYMITMAMERNDTTEPTREETEAMRMFAQFLGLLTTSCEPPDLPIRQ